MHPSIRPVDMDKEEIIQSHAVTTSLVWPPNSHSYTYTFQYLFRLDTPKLTKLKLF